MTKRVARRDLLKLLGASATALVGQPFYLPSLTRTFALQSGGIRVYVTPVSAHTVRITFAKQETTPLRVPRDGSLLTSVAEMKLGPPSQGKRATNNNLRVDVQAEQGIVRITTTDGRNLQELRWQPEPGVLNFSLGEGPLLALGEGGPQFDRRGSQDRMRSGQGGYQLRTHGGRVPVQWLIGTSGWAMFIHQPLGSFDFSGSAGVFTPFAADSALPLDVFVVDAKNPEQAMAEYARLTGHPEMPPLWSLGYQQSHRTLASREEIISEAKTFREKKLPCDTMIYLGTGFTPSGWNTANGSFQFNPRIFDDPKDILDEFHALNFHVVLHSVILTRTLRGTVHDPCPSERFDMEEAACAWNAHRKDFALGVDGCPMKETR